jgi:predicted HAD superfamily phosphohydrolase YqeG
MTSRSSEAATDREGWTSTAWQSLPRILHVLRNLAPTLHLPDVRGLDDTFLARHGVAALIWDVDGTLMPYHHARVSDEFAAALDGLRGKVPQAILSNCDEERFHELGRIFAHMPIVKGYRHEDSSLVFRCGRGGEERWSSGLGAGRRAIERPSGRLTALRKPSAELVHVTLDELGLEDGRGAFMVGDQYFTDIAGANLAGIRSVKVETTRPDTFPLTLRGLQAVERGLFFVHGLFARRPVEGAASR